MIVRVPPAPPGRITHEGDRYDVYRALRRRDHARRQRDFEAACQQLYAERMVRTANPATVRLSDADAALARQLVADQLTYEAHCDASFSAFRFGGPRR
jgi:hypothetical protein